MDIKIHNYREPLTKFLISNSEKLEYIDQLKNNFEKNIKNLDYDLEYLINLKQFLYSDCYYFIHNTFNKELKKLIDLEYTGNFNEKLNINSNLNFYKSMDFDTIICTYPHFIMYIENKKINFFINKIYSGNKIDLLDNCLNHDYKPEAIMGMPQGLDNWMPYEEDFISLEDYSDVLDKLMLELFFEKLHSFQKNEISKNLPKINQELSKLISGNNEINWIPSEPFTKLLENNESLIYDKNNDYLLKFVKLDSFLNTKRKSLINIHKEIIKTEDEVFIFSTIPILINQIEYYNQLLLMSINMIVALKNNKMILFFKIFETFDQLGVFDSNWEKSLLNKMDDLNMSIKDLVNQIEQMEMRLNQRIEDLGFDIQQNIDDMKDSVIDEISNLNNGSSILPLINTFQLIGIKNKLS